MNRKRFVAALMRHETNTFSPVPTPVSTFGRIGSTYAPAPGEEPLRPALALRAPERRLSLD